MKRTILTAITLLLAITLQAQKRVNNHMYNPDPAPVVSGDRLYVFTGHDLDTATYFRMPDWQLFSTTDMERWTDHGVVLSTANFKWAKQGDNAWASQAIERNGKWYWYVAAEDTTKHLHGIGVAVADRPEGPWTDPIGKPLIPGDWGFIDPTVFIDDDGQAWLFWGNNGCWYAKLNKDMISIDKSFANNGICDMRPMLDDEAQFGPKCMKMDYQLHKRVMKTGFEEAPWVYKIGDTYFLEYAAGGVPEHWAYSTSKSIHGPWHYEGRITDESPGSFTIHGGTIDFKGKSYLFYHDGIPSGGNGFRRTTAYREFQRMKDGRIPKINLQAQEIKMNEPTVGDYLPLLQAKGYKAYSFDTKDIKDAMVEPIVMEYNKGEEPREVAGFSISMNMGEKLVIGFIPTDNDSTGCYTFQFSESRGFNSRLRLMPICDPAHPTDKWYMYESRPFELVPPFEKGKFIPLVLYGSYWYEPEHGGCRFCGDSFIKPDLSSDIVKSIPHFYVLGIKII